MKTRMLLGCLAAVLAGCGTDDPKDGTQNRADELKVHDSTPHNRDDLVISYSSQHEIDDFNDKAAQYEEIIRHKTAKFVQEVFHLSNDDTAWGRLAGQEISIMRGGSIHYVKGMVEYSIKDDPTFLSPQQRRILLALAQEARYDALEMLPDQLEADNTALLNRLNCIDKYCFSDILFGQSNPMDRHDDQPDFKLTKIKYFDFKNHQLTIIYSGFADEGLPDLSVTVKI